MRLLLTGASGQLAGEVQRAWQEQGRDPADLVALDRITMNLTQPRAVHRAVLELQPEVVFNAAAFVGVDDSESRRLVTLRVNAAGPSILASACAEIGASLVHVSTDYVFDGSATSPYDEDAITRPVNFYGLSKLLGERAVQRHLPQRHLIVRTSGLYGTPMSAIPRNFVSRILDADRRREVPRVVNDQVCTPTSAKDVAGVILGLIDAGAGGIVHVTNQGACSWFEFAVAALREANVRADITPITSKELGRAARRPAYSVLANNRLALWGIAQPGPWQMALRHYVASQHAGMS